MRHAAKLDAFFAMPYELHVRFGRWDQMLAEPAPPKDQFRIARAFWHFARGTALAAKNRIAEAEMEQAAFRTAVLMIPATAVFQKNRASAILDVADSMLAGEILYRQGRTDEAISRLREAVTFEDVLQYCEPPEWILPARHVLGATLIDAGRPAEAEAIYREDLRLRPENGWSLSGLSRALRMQKKTAEAAAVADRLKKAWQHADIKLTGSCLCLPAKD